MSPETAARKLIEIAKSVNTIQDGRVYIPEITGPFLSEHNGTVEQYGAGLRIAIDRGWLDLHESGKFVRLTKAGANSFT